MFGNRKWVSPQFQPIRIEILRQQLSLTDEQQMPGRGIHGRCIRVEQAFRVQSVELADIDATSFRATGHEEEKVPAIGEEPRGRMAPCCGDSNRVAAEGSPPSAETRKIGLPGFVEKTIVPSLFHAPPRATGRGRQCLHRSAVDVHPLQLVIRKEPDGAAVGRPERAMMRVRSLPTAAPTENPATAATTETGLRTWPRRRSSVHRARSPAMGPWSEAC